MLAISYLANVAEPVAALVVFAGPDGALSAGAKAADAAAKGAVQSAVKAARFEGGVGEIVELLAPAGLSHGRLLLVGTGPTDKIDAGVAERIGGAIAARLLLSGETTVSVDVAGVLDGDLAANLAHGAVLRSWRSLPRARCRPRTPLPFRRRWHLHRRIAAPASLRQRLLASADRRGLSRPRSEPRATNRRHPEKANSTMAGRAPTPPRGPRNRARARLVEKASWSHFHFLSL